MSVADRLLAGTGLRNSYPLPMVQEDDGDYADDGFRAPKRFFPDTYLDSPILTTMRTRWLSAMLTSKVPEKEKDGWFFNTFRDTRKALPNMSSFDIIDPEQYPSIYHMAWQSTLSSELTEAWAVASDIRRNISVALAKKTGIQSEEVPFTFPPDALEWYNRWSYFDSLVEEFSRVCSLNNPNTVTIRLGSHTTVQACKEVWFLENRDFGIKWMLTYDQVLMIKDVFFSRAQVLTALAVLFPRNAELKRSVLSTFSWHEECLLRYRNPGFEILKQTEALAKAYLSQMTDEVFGDDGPYNRMLDKIVEKEKKLIDFSLLKDQPRDFLAYKYDRVLRRCTDVQSVVEIYGLLKVSGHPLVDPLVGGASAAFEAQTPDRTLFQDAEHLDWEFKRCMLENYVLKEGKWPYLDFVKGAPRTRLRDLCNRQTKRLNRHSYPLSDWRYCRFGKIVEFDFSPNYLDLIDDRSISLYRTNVAAFWDRDIPTTSHRRLLIELINRKEIDLKAIVFAIMNRQIPFDWLIVSLHPKEREFKLAPRMFSMLVFEIRIFFALTEANIADRIFPYLPQQTMTKSRQAISQIFLDMTKPLSPEDSLRMFIEIDLSRWNLRWRELTIGMIGRTLNDMFGMPGVFDYCHEFFSSALIIVRVPGLRPTGIELPDPPNSELVWRNHLGGFEGICQKLWTIATYMMVAHAIADLPISYILIGQGDNQILSIRAARETGVDDKLTLTRLRDDLTSRIEQTCASVNQEVKPEECLESTTVITYSKDVYVRGVYRPTSLKFHSRLFPHSSQVFPSLRTNIGAIFSTAMAGAEKSVDPLISHFLACFQSSLYLNRVSLRRGPYGQQVSGIRRALGTRWLEFVQFVCVLPSECGGYPTVPPIGFMYKGGSDPLGKSVSSMVLLGKYSGSRMYNRMLAQLSSDDVYNPEPKIASLFMDPFSAPFDKPPTAVDGVARETMAALTAHVKTEHIAELVHADTTKYMDMLTEALSECRPLNPLLTRDITDCSYGGVTDTFSRMFVATRTMQEVVRSMGVQVVEKILHLECKGVLYMHHRFVHLPKDPAADKTAFQLTTEMRNRWYPSSKECPIVGLTTYQPLDFDITWSVDPLKVEGINAVLIASSDPTETRGPYNPYTGSKTREKRSEHGFKIVGTDGASRSMRKLQLIASQTGNDESFIKLIDVVGWSRTNTQLSSVSHLLPGVSGGTLSHRYAARAGHLDAWNIGSPNFATHCVVSSDNTGKLAGGVHDYPLMFQEYLLMSIWFLLYRYQKTGTLYQSVTIVTGGRDLEPLPEVTIKGPSHFTLPVKRFPNNPLAFLPNLCLEQVSGSIRHPSLPVDEDTPLTNETMRHVIEGFYREALRSGSTSRLIADGASTSLFQKGTMDIAEVMACGVGALAHGIANVCTDVAIADFIATDALKYKRWKASVYAAKLVSPLVATISPHIGHPLLRNDPYLRNNFMYDEPTYAGGYSQSHQRLCGRIQSLIRERLSGYSTQYNHRAISLFTSSAARSTSELILTALLSDLYIWRINGSLQASEVNALIAKQVIPQLRQLKSEEDRVQVLFRVIGNMIAIFKKSKHYHEMQILQKYISGSRIKAYKITIADFLRSFRGWPGSYALHVVKKKQPVLKLGPQHPTPRQFPTVHWSTTKVGTRTLREEVRDQLAILQDVFQRNRGRYIYSTGTSLYYWLAYSSLFPTTKAVIVIGSGFGAVSRVCLDAGVPAVYGLDLRSSIPIKAHRFTSYRPPLVNSSEYESRYTQLPESYTTSGDWTDLNVVSRVLLYDGGRDTVVIDIEAGKKRYGLELLRHIISIKSQGLIFLRLFLSLDELHLLYTDLKASGVECHVFDDGGMRVTSRLFVLYKWSKTLVVASEVKVESIAEPTLLVDTSLLPADADHRAIAVSDALFNVVTCDINSSLCDLELELDQMIVESYGSYDSRFSYDTWTRFLQAKVVLTWLMLQDEPAAWSAIVSWSHRSSITVKVKQHTIDVNLSYRLLRHLCSYGSRVLGILSQE